METGPTARYADMFAALGNEARLRIMRLLLAAHPEGMVPGDLQNELGIPASTLSHHLDKLKHEGLADVRREGTHLWYRADSEALREVLQFLYAECCTRSPRWSRRRRSRADEGPEPVRRQLRARARPPAGDPAGPRTGPRRKFSGGI